MYTSEMRRAVHSLAHYSPKNFYLDIVDEDHFITVIAPEKVFMALRDVESKRRAVDYMIRIKKALEDNGAIVLLVREGGKDERK
tara:strand:- start:15312 stop:15563 length:252 start_codon:yes stop_codon:yes gene_type:complete